MNVFNLVMESTLQEEHDVGVLGVSDTVLHVTIVNVFRWFD